MKERLAALLFAMAFAVAGCGGGGSTGGGGGGGNPLPVTTPAPGATTAPQSNLPSQDTVAGSMGWVDATTHRTLYYLDTDTATGGGCTSSCLTVWPIFAPSAGSQNTDNMTIITRSDGAGQQWAYQLHPLYFYAGDSGPDQANGESIPHWHVARPAAAASPPPGGNPPPCHGYC